MSIKIVRHGDLIPCKTAFIDTHTPGSDQKENFTIIGVGVSESADQHIHIKDKLNFSIGAAGQPPRCRNSLHSHRTAEIFCVLKGRWRFFWGRWGDAGEVVLQEGDIINVPTYMFRGFENIGDDYGMLMAVLGGHDGGGGVEWAPQVIEEARQHGLMLGDNGKLYDSKKDEIFPEGVNAMPLLSDEQLKNYAEPTAAHIVNNHVARYWDLVALSKNEPSKVIAEDGLLRDKPGVEIDFITRHSFGDDFTSINHHTVLLPMKGYWNIIWDNNGKTEQDNLSAGDTCLIPPSVAYKLNASTSQPSSLYRIVETDDKAGRTWTPSVAA